MENEYQLEQAEMQLLSDLSAQVMVTQVQAQGLVNAAQARAQGALQAIISLRNLKGAWHVSADKPGKLIRNEPDAPAFKGEIKLALGAC